MKLFNKIAIIGVGLIGGSIALALKKRGLVEKIVGVARHKKSLLLAKKIGAIDEGSQSINIIKGSDLIILAAPINTILKTAQKISKVASPKAIVSDVGSTKELIVSRLEKFFPNFIGGHPLAGSEKKGIINAHPEIFKGSLCILTPTKLTDSKALNKIKALWHQLGAKVILISAHDHDEILSFISHLAHAAAFSLVKSVPDKFLEFASTGFKDTTRIAASESEIWSDILLSNQKNVLKAITLFQANLLKIKTAIQKNNKRQLSSILNSARKKRQSI
ncbi:MAG: prephenate dehydrogenase/arogenate dehydrogenase family protein [Candidatus Omnitrophota bacterium]|nr:prephenate dehydrogenase/arogenate dehydrogenase family protein [Candidatus Omnitrophota bacterium]